MSNYFFQNHSNLILYSTLNALIEGIWDDKLKVRNDWIYDIDKLIVRNDWIYDVWDDKLKVSNDWIYDIWDDKLKVRND